MITFTIVSHPLDASDTQLITLPTRLRSVSFKATCSLDKKGKKKHEAIKESDTPIGGQLCACFPQ